MATNLLAWVFVLLGLVRLPSCTFGITYIEQGEKDPLYEPDRIDLTADGSAITLYVRLCQYTVLNSTGFLYVDMTRYCYCTDESEDDSCSYPGPTLEMMSNTSITVTLANQLTGSTEIYEPGTEFWNHYKDMDTTNLHTHGLHVSPFVDDILRNVTPGNSHDYEYEFGFHYPGTFWYHAHHHGSTTWQVNQGLHGAILMHNNDDQVSKMYEENILMFNWMYLVNTSICLNVSGDCLDAAYEDYKMYPEYLNVEYGDIIENYKLYIRYSDEFCSSYVSESDEYANYTEEEYVMSNGVETYIDVLDSTVFDFENLSKLLDALQAGSVELAEASYDCTDTTGNTVDDYSMCNIYCCFPEDQRNVSGYVYDIYTDIVFNKSRDESKSAANIKCFVNGQLSPIIDDMQVGHIRRLRFINSYSNFYLQMKFPTEHCTWWFIASDGVYFNSDNRNYDLSNSSHNGTYMVAPGGRVDILVNCSQEGLYDIVASQDISFDLQLTRFDFQCVGSVLFSIDVNANVGRTRDGDTVLPTSTNYTNKPKGTYIQDLSNLSAIIDFYQDECPCNAEGSDVSGTDECRFTFYLNNPGQNSSVNGIRFNYDSSAQWPFIDDSLNVISENMAYEFTIDNNGDVNGLPPVAHVFHVHTSPFQVYENIGAGGYIALPKTWWDTLGNYPYGTPGQEQFIQMRTWTRDYTGLIIVHCHLLQHEDKGMMGFFNIITNSTNETSECPNLDQGLQSDGIVKYTVECCDSLEDDIADLKELVVADLAVSATLFGSVLLTILVGCLVGLGICRNSAVCISCRNCIAGGDSDPEMGIRNSIEHEKQDGSRKGRDAKPDGKADVELADTKESAYVQ